MKKRKRVILHIGKPKTGTTSIQESLGRQRKTLLDYDIYYPEGRPFNHIFNFVPIFLTDPYSDVNMIKEYGDEKEIRNKISEFKEYWISEFKRSKCSDFIISAENLYYLEPSEIVTVQNFLEKYFTEIKIIVYFREYNSLLSSSVQQDLKNGFSNESIEDLVNRHLNIGVIKKDVIRMKQWITAFGKDNVIVRPFARDAFLNGSLLADFMKYSGLEVEGEVHEYSENNALGLYATTFLAAYNAKFPVFKNNKLNLSRSQAGKYIDERLYKINMDVKFDLNISYSSEQVEIINDNLDYFNNLFDDGFRFELLEYKETKTSFPKPEDIPVGFYVDLINNYKRRVERLENELNR